SRLHVDLRVHGRTVDDGHGGAASPGPGRDRAHPRPRGARRRGGGQPSLGLGRHPAEAGAAFGGARGGSMTLEGHQVVSHEAWVEARKALLAHEKEFTRQRDELSRARRALPWEKVEKEYAFDGPSGRQTLRDLFDGRSQLAVYHFMFAPEWDEGCPHCSFW